MKADASHVVVVLNEGLLDPAVHCGLGIVPVRQCLWNDQFIIHQDVVEVGRGHDQSMQQHNYLDLLDR